MGMKHLHTLWPRGRESLKLAAHCLQHRPPPSLREPLRLLRHSWSYGHQGHGAGLVCPPYRCLWDAGLGASWTWWFSIRHEPCHAPQWPSRSRKICWFLTAATLLIHTLSDETCFKSYFLLSFSKFLFTILFKGWLML